MKQLGRRTKVTQIPYLITCLNTTFRHTQ